MEKVKNAVGAFMARWRPVLLALLAYAAVRWSIALCELSPENDHPFWLWFVAAGFLYAYGRFFDAKKHRARRYAAVFAFFFLLFQLVGRQYDFARQRGSGITVGGWSEWLQCFGLAALLTPVLAWPLGSLLTYIKKQASVPFADRPAGKMSEPRVFCCYVLALMLMWQPYHMAYYPGLVEYDSGYQLWQIWNGVYDASNPLLHTFILGGFYRLGEALGTPSGGIAWFCYAQRLYVSACIGYALLTLRRNRAPKTWIVISLIFFGVFPVFGMLAISCTKDVPFYATVLLQMSMIFDGCRNPERVRTRRYWIALLLVTTFACLLRANALFAMFAIAPLICWACKNRPLRRALALFLLLGVALAYGCNCVLVAVTDAHPTMMRESLNVPIIQLARVSYYHEEVAQDMTDNYAGLVEMPLPYIPYVVDLAKWPFTIDKSTVGEFAGLWAKYLRQYPLDYLDALLLLNKGYWYIGDRTFPKVYGDAAEQRFGAIPSRVSAGIDTIVEYSRLPALQEHLERMYSTNDYLNVPLLRELMSPALYVWALLYCLAACLYCRRWDARIIVRYGLLFLAALLVGPCCIIRYALLFMLLLPVLIGMLLTGVDGMFSPDAPAGVPPREFFRFRKKAAEDEAGEAIE